MDRLAAIQAFVAAVDAGSLAAAGRKLGCSAPAMTRAVASLERDAGGALFERTNRLVRLTEVGERYVAVARRILAEFEALNALSADPRAGLQGRLSLTAPLVAGADILRPVVQEFLAAHPDIKIELRLSDRLADLSGEGVDLGLRIAHLPDSALIARRVGQVRQVVCASAGYLANRPPIEEPQDLLGHEIIALADSNQAKSWAFRGPDGAPQTVRLAPRLSPTTVDAALASAVDGVGVARLFSYQVAEAVRSGRLKVLLEPFEPAPFPIHLIAPQVRWAQPRARAFVAFALPRLKAAFAERDRMFRRVGSAR